MQRVVNTTQDKETAAELFSGCERGANRIRTDASRFCRPFPYHLGMAPMLIA